MRKLILQLFLNEYQVKAKIAELQAKPQVEWDEKVIDVLHKEWDRYTHMINLFFEAVKL